MQLAVGLLLPFLGTTLGAACVFFKEHLGPSAHSAPIWRCGTARSIPSKNKIPSKNPAAAGINAYFPISSDISIAGIRSDHTDAATIPPDANPRSIF